MPIRPNHLVSAGIILLLTACQQVSRPSQHMSNPAKLAEINTELGSQYLQKGEYEIALKKLEKALDADRNYADAHNTLGVLRSRLGQFDQAEKSFRRAISIDSNNSSALNNFGQFLCQRQRYEEGEAQFLLAVENPLYKYPAQAYSNAGSCALDAGKLEVAERHFRKALQLDGKLAPALLQMADISVQREQFLPGRAYLQRYSELARMNVRALWLGVQVERELGDRDAVSSYALSLEKNFPDSDQTRLLRESRDP